MSDEVRTFANNWVFENVNAESYDPPAHVIDALAERLREDAEKAGITEEMLLDTIGEPSDFIAEAYDEHADNEVDRLASKDD